MGGWEGGGGKEEREGYKLQHTYNKQWQISKSF